MRTAVTLTTVMLVALIPLSSLAAGRGGGGGGSRGGFDMSGDTATHSSTGPAGTSRSTTATNTGTGYNRTTTASNGNYNRTSSGSMDNGNYSHSSNGTNGYGSHSSSTSGNTSTGNYTHSGSGSNPNGSYNTQGSGNAYNRTYSGSGTATNAYGQTYHSQTYANNGTVYHGAVVTNPVYVNSGVWGWNGGVAWYPAPTYYGGGFWGPFAIGVTSAVVYGTIVAANNTTVTSYQTQPNSPGATLLQNYQLTQVQCGPPNLVVIYGPNNSAICARPNQLVAAGNYSVNTSNLTIVSQKPA